MKPTKGNMKIHASKEPPVLSIENGYLGRHANEPTILLPIELSRGRESKRNNGIRR